MAQDESNEVTERMIKAGVSAFMSEPHLEDDPERLVIVVYRAMLRSQLEAFEHIAGA